MSYRQSPLAALWEGQLRGLLTQNLFTVGRQLPFVGDRLLPVSQLPIQVLAPDHVNFNRLNESLRDATHCA